MPSTTEEKDPKYRICPHLGQRTDQGTALSYPSALNYCIHARPMAAIDLEHQEEFCLTLGYENCEEYGAVPGARLPAGLHKSSGRQLQQRPGKSKWVWGLLLAGLVSIVAWQVLARVKYPSQPLKTPTGMIEIPSTATQISSTDLPPTAVPATTSTPAGTASSRPILALDTPLGIDHRFIIVQVQAGDSLERIANKHGTTLVALQAINHRIPSPLVPGWAIVSLMDSVDTQGLPSFEVYPVVEEKSLKDLAILLSVDLNEFKYYNALDDNFIPRAGDLLLVPRFGTTTYFPTPTPTP